MPVAARRRTGSYNRNRFDHRIVRGAPKARETAVNCSITSLGADASASPAEPLPTSLDATAGARPLCRDHSRRGFHHLAKRIIDMNNRNKNSRSLIGEDGLDDKALGAVVGGAAKTAVPGMAAGGINEIANAAHSAAHEIEGAFGSVGAAFGGAHGPAASAGVVVAHSSPVDTVVGSHAAGGISAGASAANNAAHAIESAFASGGHGPVVAAHSSPVDTLIAGVAAGGHVTTAVADGFSEAGNAARAIESAFSSW